MSLADSIRDSDSGVDQISEQRNSPHEDLSWLGSFPVLRDVDDPIWLEIAANAKRVTLPQSTVVFRDGDACENYLLVLEGVVRVHKTSETGREIVLYRVERGQTCVLTTSTLLARRPYPAAGITESETHAMAIPAERFHYAFDHSRGFRHFAVTEYGGRICDLIVLLEAVAFGRVDVRLAEWLFLHRDADNMVQTTHQALADELGTAREVISRQLKEFEHRGWIEMSRRKTKIMDPQALEQLVGANPPT